MSADMEAAVSVKQEPCSILTEGGLIDTNIDSDTLQLGYASDIFKYSGDDVKLASDYIGHRKEKKRKVWVKSHISEKRTSGGFMKCFEDLRQDEAKFFDCFRMSTSTFDELQLKMQCYLTRQNTNMRNSIPPVERLGVTLRYLGSGCSFNEIHHDYGLGISTVCVIVEQVCSCLWSVLCNDCFPKPTTESIKKMADRFQETTNFPNCFGSLEGKLIRFMPKEKNTFNDCFVSMAGIADSDYRFFYVDIRASGAADITTSAFWRLMTSGELKMPKPRPLYRDGSAPVPYVLIGGEGFPLLPNLMRPYFGNTLTEERRAFNQRHSRAKRTVECAFGILSNKWKILQRPLHVGVQMALKIIHACFILHNFVIDREGFVFEDILSITGLQHISSESQQGRKTSEATIVRRTFTDYFVSDEGSLEWQIKNT